MSEQASPKNLEENDNKPPHFGLSKWLDRMINAAQQFITFQSKLIQFFQDEEPLTLEQILLAEPPGSEGFELEANEGFGHELFRVRQLQQESQVPEEIVKIYSNNFEGALFEEMQSIPKFEEGMQNTLNPISLIPFAPMSPIIPPYIPPIPPMPSDPTEDELVLTSNSQQPMPCLSTIQNTNELLFNKIQEIDNAIEREQYRLSILKKNAAILSEEIELVKAHLLNNIVQVQNDFANLNADKKAIEPLLTPFATHSILKTVVGGIEYLLNILKPTTIAHWLKINPQPNLGDILVLSNMIEQYELSGSKIKHQAQQLAIDIASKILTKPVEDYAQAQVVSSEYHNSPDLQHSTPLYADLVKSIQAANQIDAYFDKVHTLFLDCNHFANEFKNLCACNQSLQDTKVQIEGRTENIALLKAEHQLLIQLLQQNEASMTEHSLDSNPTNFGQFLENRKSIHALQLSSDDVFNDTQQCLCYSKLNTKDNSQHSEILHGQIHLEIPGYCAEQQPVTESQYFI